ncbi:helix-turn-helix transcriptional regulator [Listeria sp. PSOL-1]|uniref:helix-turn-helix domain-containing protein n=1 Tax=Listeria sp. PSOL-1 TaxID=1844999 RepID=UPI0013D221BC|nr:helix-turn-helix transcriptional regulator [Listeria sp. PSOL-1]
MRTKKTGETLRKIRKNANATVKEFYGTIISEQYAYRVENDLQKISQKNLNAILEKQNILPDEFVFIQNNFMKNDLEQVLDQLFALSSNLDTKKIQKLLEVINTKKATNPSPFYNYLEQVLKAYPFFNKKQHFHTLLEPIWNELAKKEQWTYCELVVVNLVIYAFDFSSIDVLAKRLFKELERYRTFKNVARLQLITWFNYCTLLRTHGRIMETKPLLKKTLEQALAQNNGLLICECKFRLLEIAWLEKSEAETKLHAKVSKIISALRLLHHTKIAEDLSQDWQKRTGHILEEEISDPCIVFYK